MVLHRGFNWIPDPISKKSPCGTGYCRENWIFIFVLVRWEEFIYRASLSWQSQNISFDLCGEKEWRLKTQLFPVLLKLVIWSASIWLSWVFSSSQSAFLDQKVSIWHIMDHLLLNWQVCLVEIYTRAYCILQLVSLQVEHPITFAGSLI